MPLLKDRAKFDTSGVYGFDKGGMDFDLETTYTLKIYDTSDVKVAEIAGDLENTTLTQLAFKTNRKGGCAEFSFTLAEPYTTATIAYNYKVEIYLFNHFSPWFTGYIEEVPDPAGASIDVKTLLAGVTAAEMGEIANIGATTISATQWGALGALVEWTDWTPTLTGDADLNGYDTARYYRIGDICFYYITADNQNVTSAGTTIQITLPFTSANTSKTVAAANLHDGTTWVGTPQNQIDANTNYIQIFKSAAGGSWAGDETGVYIRISGFFEIV